MVVRGGRFPTHSGCSDCFDLQGGPLNIDPMLPPNAGRLPNGQSGGLLGSRSGEMGLAGGPPD